MSVLIFVPGVLADYSETADISGTADHSNTADISGNPALSMTFTVSGSHFFGDMALGDNVNSTANSVKVYLVSNAPWAVGVSDVLGTKPAKTEGKMVEWITSTNSWVPGGKVLTTAFNVGSNADTWIPLTGSSQQLWSGHAGTFTKYPYFKQRIETVDTRVASGHVYRVVTTFTAIAT
ncbi:MAG: hypothetical protein WC626_06585 [Methanoregula sp.]